MIFIMSLNTTSSISFEGVPSFMLVAIFLKLLYSPIINFFSMFIFLSKKDFSLEVKVLFSKNLASTSGGRSTVVRYFFPPAIGEPTPVL